MKRKYYLFDVQGKVLGRAATEIARVLSGKGKVEFTPNIDGGDYVVVINADQVQVTGNKPKNKIYYSHSGYPGGIKEISFKKQIKKDSSKVIKRAVLGMLPKNKLGKGMSKRLLVYRDDKHSHKIDEEKKL